MQAVAGVTPSVARSSAPLRFREWSKPLAFYVYPFLSDHVAPAKGVDKR